MLVLWVVSNVLLFRRYYPIQKARMHELGTLPLLLLLPLPHCSCCLWLPTPMPGRLLQFKFTEYGEVKAVDSRSASVYSAPRHSSGAASGGSASTTPRSAAADSSIRGSKRGARELWRGVEGVKPAGQPVEDPNARDSAAWAAAGTGGGGGAPGPAAEAVWAGWPGLAAGLPLRWRRWLVWLHLAAITGFSTALAAVFATAGGALAMSLLAGGWLAATASMLLICPLVYVPEGWAIPACLLPWVPSLAIGLICFRCAQQLFVGGSSPVCPCLPAAPRRPTCSLRCCRAFRCPPYDLALPPPPARPSSAASRSWASPAKMARSMLTQAISTQWQQCCTSSTGKHLMNPGGKVPAQDRALRCPGCALHYGFGNPTDQPLTHPLTLSHECSLPMSYIHQFRRDGGNTQEEQLQ